MEIHNKDIMEEKKGKDYLKYNLLSLFLVVGLIVVTAVIAGDFVVKEGNVEIGNDINVSNVLFVNSTSGRVGVGTKSPQGLLHIESNVSGATIGRFITGGAASANVFNLVNNRNVVNDNWGISFQDSFAIRGTVRGLNENSGNSRGTLLFQTADGVSGLVERMRINSDGEVGINTNNPDARLHINNTLKLTPTDSPTSCVTVGKGGIYFDDSLIEPCFCNGTAWLQFDGGGSC